MQAGDYVRVIASEKRLRSIGAFMTDTSKIYRIKKTDPISNEGLYFLLNNEYWYSADDLEVIKDDEK
jgi:hypothetical protein